MACHATTDADIEVVVAGSTIGDVLHLNLAQNHSKDAEKAVHGVALPMFQDAAALALDADDQMCLSTSSAEVVTVCRRCGTRCGLEMVGCSACDVACDV